MNWDRMSSASATILGAVLRQLRTLHKALANRHEVKRLAELDERALKDIGLMRSDVDGALSEPWHRDPSALLVGRRLEHETPAAVTAGIRTRTVPTVRPAAC